MWTTHECCLLFWTNPWRSSVDTCLSSHKLSKTDKICWVLLDLLIYDVLLWTATQGHTSVGRLAKTYSNQFFEDIGCNLQQLLRNDGWYGMDGESDSKDYMSSARLEDDNDDDEVEDVYVLCARAYVCVCVCVCVCGVFKKDRDWSYIYKHCKWTWKKPKRFFFIKSRCL